MDLDKQGRVIIDPEDADAAYDILIGADEAGVGPLAGPVVGAAVAYDPTRRIPKVRDSKRMNEKARERACAQIVEEVNAWAVCFCSSSRIDEIGIFNARFEALHNATAKVRSYFPESCVIVDGDRKIPGICPPHMAYIKADDFFHVVSAASVLAKVFRDRWMKVMDLFYPDYGFARHKGYPTLYHMENLVKYGPCPLHRRSFGPVKQAGSFPHKLI